jgi:heptosyltransferase-2
VPSFRLLQQHGYAPRLVGKGWAVSLLAGEPWPVHRRVEGLRANAALLRSLRLRAIDDDPGFDRRANAMVLPNSFSSALEMRLAGLRAVGYAKEGRSPLLRRAFPAPAYAEHVLMRYWRLACAFLGVEATPPAAIELNTSPEHQREADERLAREGVRPGFVVICPMAGGTFEKLDKRWPRFADFTRELLREGRDVIACPGPGEEAIISDHHPGVRSLTGIDLGVYGGVLRRAAVVVSNDTGPAHLAAAVGTPLVSVLGPTLPEQWGPWGPTVEIVRRWPGWPEVDEVMQRVRALLEGR